MFLTRLLSGIVLVIITAVLMVLGGPFLWIGVLLTSLLGMYELYSLVEIDKTPLGIAGYICAVLYGVSLLLGHPDGGLLIVLIAFGVLMCVYVFQFPEYTADQAMLAFFGFVYVPVMLFNLYRVRILDEGYLAWLVFLGSWGCDTCAYCVGIKFGKRRMAPVLSPKKSVEGAIGGIAGSALLGLIFGAVFASHLTIFTHPVISCTIICAVAAVISMVGDLTASAIKRNHSIKDYSNLIPGHGGILDRFDSVIFVAPVIYYLTVLLSA